MEPSDTEETFAGSKDELTRVLDKTAEKLDVETCDGAWAAKASGKEIMVYCFHPDMKWSEELIDRVREIAASSGPQAQLFKQFLQRADHAA